jgi:hypothetical protein
VGFLADGAQFFLRLLDCPAAQEALPASRSDAGGAPRLARREDEKIKTAASARERQRRAGAAL